MYQIFYDGTMIYDPRLAAQDDRYITIDPLLDVAVDAAGTFEFTLTATHPAAEGLQRMGPLVEVTEDGEPIFRGRIVNDHTTFHRDVQIECEGQLACLHDSAYIIDEPITLSSNTDVRNMLNEILTGHRAFTGSANQALYIGTVDVSISTPVTLDITGPVTSWEALEAIREATGAHIVVRYSDVTYVDLITRFTAKNPQAVEYAQNLLDLGRECYGGDYYNAIYPIGEEGLTIAAEPDGSLTNGIIKDGVYLIAQDEAAAHGRIVRIIDFPEVVDANVLKTEATKVLAQLGLTMPETIRCQAADLAGIEGVQSFRVGALVAVKSPAHGLSAMYPLMELSVDLLRPWETEIVFGASTRTISSSIASAKTDIIGTTQTMIQKASADVTKQITTQYQSDLTKTADQINASVTKNTEAIQGVSTRTEETSTQMTQLSDSVNLEISKSQEQISEIDGRTQSQISQITKIFRATLEGLIIGQEGSDSQLRLDNDVIEFLVANFAAVTIDLTGLSADQATLREIHIGAYTLKAGSNGHLTLS